MRTFSLISLLVTALLIAWLSASWMRLVTSGGESAAPASEGAAVRTRGSPVDRANELASMDRARQKQMEELMR